MSDAVTMKKIFNNFLENVINNQQAFCKKDTDVTQMEQ